MTDFRPHDSMPVSIPEGNFTGEFGSSQPYGGGGAAQVAVSRSPLFWIRRELTEAFLRVLRNWWMVLGLWCIVSMGLGYLVANFLGKQTWKSEVTLLYNAPSSTDQRDASSGPKLKTLQTLVKDAANLKKTIELVKNDPEKVGVPDVITVKMLEANLTVTPPPGADTLVLALKWDNKEGANYLLTKVQEQFLLGVHDHLVARAQKDLLDVENAITAAEKQLDELLKKQKKELEESKITDIKGDQAELKDKITSLEYQLRLDVQAEVGAKEELKTIERKLDDLKKTVAKESESEEEDQAQSDTISDNRRRQDRIRELMGDEKEQISLQAQLEEKNFKRVRLEGLLLKNAVAKEDVDQVLSEIRTIKAKMDGNKKTKDWDNEMTKIDKLIVPKKGKKMNTSPIITQIMDKELDRQLKIMGLKQEEDHLSKEIEAAKAKLAYIISIEGKFEEKVAKVNAAKLSLASLVSRRSVLEGAISSTKSDLSELGPPDAGDYAVGSTKPLLFGISSLGGICLGLFSLLGWEIFARAGTPSNLARRLEIPVPDLRSRPEELARQSRNISRQLRQRDPGQGMILTVHPVAATPACIDKALGVAKELGASFSKRGERVLIIQLDSGTKSSSTLGLSDYIFNRVDSPAMVIRPTDDLSCDMMPTGTESLDADSLANQRMTDFMEQARERYGVIIIVGHALNNLSEVEILASNSQSIVLVADGEKPIGTDAREALFELSRMRAPVSAMMIR